MVISTRVIGKRKSPVEDWNYEPPNDLIEQGDGGITLRELIELVVRDEVRNFRERQKRERLVFVLSSKEIREGAEKGKVTMGGKEMMQEVDEDVAVGTALEAFEDGLYLVFIDEVEQRELDQQVFVQLDTKMVFVRLTFLAGA